jgi:hypothetical protein
VIADELLPVAFVVAIVMGKVSWPSAVFLAAVLLLGLNFFGDFAIHIIR